MENCKELSEKGDLILASVATAKITPSEASSLMTAISIQAKIVEADELEKRVAELENINESK